VKAPVELRGEGFGLRPFRDDDVPAITRACADPETARFIPLMPSPYTEEHAREYVAFARKLGGEGRRLPLAIADGDTQELLGAIDVRLGEIGSIGYWVGPWARNRGVATGALRLLAGWAIREGGVRRLELVTHPDNVASQRVAEKAGFSREGTRLHDPPFRDGRRESVLFALEASPRGAMRLSARPHLPLSEPAAHAARRRSGQPGSSARSAAMRSPTGGCVRKRPARPDSANGLYG
jgi:RimJ/RimL family protein N-acetyltransferase